jgi:SAM-dependent methyltransferase
MPIYLSQHRQLEAESLRNPHFDDGLIRWSDEYSGLYEAPPAYDTEFDLKWRLALEGREGYADSISDIDGRHLDDQIYTIIGKHPSHDGFYDPRMGVRVLDRPIDPALIRGKLCADAGCGLGRWTQVLQRLGAKSVLSFDASPHAIESVKRFNQNAYQADLMKLTEQHPEWVGKFDFVMYWGVAQSTHDPWIAFSNVAAMVEPDAGALYLAVYAEGGIQDQPITNITRRIFHRLGSVEEKLNFIDSVYDRRWDSRFPLKENVKNVLRNVLNRPKGMRIGVLDTNIAVYNWVIPWDVVTGWFKKTGFKRIIYLNEFENPKPHHHVLGLRE